MFARIPLGVCGVRSRRLWGERRSGLWVEDCGSASVLQLRLAKISCCSSAVGLSFSAFGPDDWTLQLSRVGRFGELAARARRSFSPPLLLRGAPAAAGGSLAAPSPPPGTRGPGPWWFFCADPTLRCADVQFGCFLSSLDVELIAVSRSETRGRLSVRRGSPARRLPSLDWRI